MCISMEPSIRGGATSREEWRSSGGLRRKRWTPSSSAWSRLAERQDDRDAGTGVHAGGQGGRVLPRQKLSYPFGFSIPDDAFLSQSGLFGSATSGCRVDARAEIPFAFDPRASGLLNVTPHRETVAIQSAMRMLGFVERGSALTLTWKALPPEKSTLTTAHPTHFSTNWKRQNCPSKYMEAGPPSRST